MKNCYKCKSEIQENFKFCPNCGSNQTEISCPAMNLELVKDVLLAFPDKVNPSKDDDWKFIKNYSTQDGLKITEKSSFGYVEEYYVNGAAPASMKKFLTQVSKKMTRKLPSGIIE